MDIRDIDLNLLPVLDALVRHQSATRAAQELNMSQSALSGALARLRELLGDELFVRTGRGLRPTLRASELAGPVSEILLQVRERVLRASSFEPSVSTREFRVSQSDVGAYVMWPLIVGAVRSSAPGVRMRLRQLAEADLLQALADNEVDMAIGSYPRLPETLYQQRLYDRRYVGLVRRGHPLGDKPLSLRQFAALPQVVVQMPSGVHDRIDAILATHGLRRTDVLEMPSVLMTPPLLQQCDLMAVIPEQLADAFASVGGFTKLELPFNLEAMPIRLHWHRRAHDDPGNQWLRQLIVGLLRPAPGPV